MEENKELKPEETEDRKEQDEGKNKQSYIQKIVIVVVLIVAAYYILTGITGLLH